MKFIVFALSVAIMSLRIFADETGFVTIVLSGDLNEGIFSPELRSADDGKNLLLMKLNQTEKKNIWRTVDKISGKHDLLILDNHPSISSSCIYSKRLNITNDIQVDVDIPSVRRELILTSERGVDLPLYFTGNPKVVVGKMRKIDEAGKVNRWVFFIKDGDSYTARVANIQVGEYLVDIMERGQQVSGQDSLGYAVWTNKLVVKEGGEERVMLSYREIGGGHE